MMPCQFPLQPGGTPGPFKHQLISCVGVPGGGMQRFTAALLPLRSFQLLDHTLAAVLL